MKRFVIFAAVAMLLAACETPADTDLSTKGKSQSGKTDPEQVSPEAKPGSALNVTEISATLTGTVVIPEGVESHEAGVLVATTASVSMDNATKYTTGAIGNNGGFSVAASGLQPGTTYYFKTYLTVNGTKTVYSAVRSFSTLDIKLTVSVSDTTAFSLNGTTVSGRIEMKATQALPVEANLYWGKDIKSAKSLVSSGNAVQLQLSDDGSFTAQMGPFDAESNYSYVVLATVLGKSAYSEFKKFVSPEPVITVTVTTEQPMSVRDTSAIFRGSYTATPTPSFTLYYGFLYHTDSRGPEYWVQLIESGALSPEDAFVGASSWGNSFFGRCEKLKPNTTYYYVAGVFRLDDNNEIVRYWLGGIQSFTTQASSQP